MRVRALIQISLGRRLFRGGIETRETRRRRTIGIGLHSSGNYRYADCYKRRLTCPMCLPSLCFHLRHQKFWIIWPDIRRHRTPSTASCIGGCSTPASRGGRRKLQRPWGNSSNKVFSKKSLLQTAKHFTTFPRIISPRFSTGHHQSLNNDMLRITAIDEFIGLQFTRLGTELQAHDFISKLSPPNTQLNTR